MAAFENTDYSIRQFLPWEVEAYKSIRLEALKNDPGMFGNSYAFEEAFDNAQWSERLMNPACACFGLYHGKDLIGLTSIIINSERPEKAYMTQSYIRLAHRGKGLSAMLYEARLNWAGMNGVTLLVIGHRASNTVSRSANQRYGFKYTHSESRKWPDGMTEDMLYYELLL